MADHDHADVFGARPSAAAAAAPGSGPTIADLVAPRPGFDWAGYAQGVQRARRDRGGRIMWDCLAGDVGLAYDYPPASAAALGSLVEAIQTLDAGRHDRDVLLLYLLLDTQTQTQTDTDAAARTRTTAADAFARMRHLPRARRRLVDGYWAADHALWPTAIALLAAPGTAAVLPAEHADALLHALGLAAPDLAPRLTVDLFRHAGLRTDTEARRTAYVRALAGTDFGRAWFYVWAAGWTASERRGEAEAEAADEDEVARERERLVRVLLDWSLMPRPRKAALEALLTLPFDAAIHQQITTYLLAPPAALPPTSFALLHDLLDLRLIAHGEYAAAIDLDRRVAALRRPTDAAGAGSRPRQAMMRELVGLLPEVQREMLAMDELEPVRPADKQGDDLAMSWEPVDLAASRAGADTPTKTVPLSASDAIRSAPAPSRAILHAIRHVQPASPVPAPQRFSPGPSSARRPDARGMDSPLRGLLNARTASPYAQGGRSASPFAPGQTHGAGPVAPDTHFQQPRNVSAAGLLRQAVAQQQQNATPGGAGALRGSPAARGGEAGKQATPVPVRVFRQLGGWDEDEQVQEQEEQQLQADEGRDKAAEDPAAQSSGVEAEDRPEQARAPRTRTKRGQQPTEQRESPKRKEAEQQADQEPVKRTRRSRQTSSQPAGSPPPTRSRQASSQPEASAPARRATRQSSQAKQSETHIPGAFPGTVPEEPEHAEAEPSQEPEEKPAKPATRPNRRARSVDKHQEGQDGDEAEKAPVRRAKRAKQPPAAPSSTKNLRMTRAQSVMSNATTEAGDDESVTSTTRRRSARLSSAAPSSPARSEVSIRQTRSRKTTQDPEATPTAGVRTRRQATAGKR